MWYPLNEKTYKRVNGIPTLDDSDNEKLAINNSNLSSFLQRSLQLPSLALFAGSGTSLGEPMGPSMHDLWVKCMLKNSEFDETKDYSSQMTDVAIKICNTVHYNELSNPNIEHFLSFCDAYLMVNDSEEEVSAFVRGVKENVLSLCSGFLLNPACDLSAYKDLLFRLAKRRVRDPRLKVFTTNYDMCFETASSDLGMMVVDGFSYTRRRRFDGQYFNYDVVRRDNESHAYIQGVIQLYKLHGSVSWERSDGGVYESQNVDPDKACLIYPAKGKYQQAFIQPYLELLSRFLEHLRQPNNCLVMSGFGFNDDHLSEPIFSAIKSNPSFKLIVSDFSACMNIYKNNKYWRLLSDAALNGADITFINSSFKNLSLLIPNLTALTPAEQLAHSLKAVTREAF
ncbi:SIR2 family protein [Aeromonas bestiarum]|uniref:SIR2 family protein n=1 Tax=Aeromonas bestiarum TaxID=105751 RepID=UPI003D25501B